MHTLADTIRTALRDASFDADAKTRSYSGRGMFGRLCLAVEGTRGSSPEAFMFRLGMALAFEIEAGHLEDAGAEILATPQRDAMGLGWVLYWPSVTPLETAEDLEG